ncbi:hypothetical protein CK203_100242 [Vitis vinifera]|uniref:Retroviral polymerase SH3-like domain-containing protein n=1 Tax=Vitis vinifera TaxID=29760 RepID=A0A438FIB7_VITVI|nr:hypothetical protein CK203_100242 [Vitis vinifera]
MVHFLALEIQHIINSLTGVVHIHPSIRFHFNSLTDATCNGLSLSLSLNHSRKSYLKVTFQRLAKGKLVHFHGGKSLALPSVGPAKTTKLCILALGTFPGNLSSKELEKEIHPTVQKGCEITSQQKGDFATLWKMLPSAGSDWLAMAATSLFQLRIVHRLKHWIVDFLNFEMSAYLCLDPSTSKIYVSRHVQFVESVFPYTSLHTTLPLPNSTSISTWIPPVLSVSTPTSSQQEAITPSAASSQGLPLFETTSPPTAPSPPQDSSAPNHLLNLPLQPPNHKSQSPLPFNTA